MVFAFESKKEHFVVKSKLQTWCVGNVVESKKEHFIRIGLLKKLTIFLLHHRFDAPFFEFQFAGKTFWQTRFVMPHIDYCFAVLAQLVEGGVKAVCLRAIKPLARLVEYQQWRIFHNRPRKQRHSLLSERKLV